MGNPAYDARREAERARYEKDKASEDAARETFEAVTALMTGKASLQIWPTACAGGPGWSVRIVRS